MVRSLRMETLGPPCVSLYKPLKKSKKMKTYLHRLNLNRWSYFTLICLAIVGIQARANGSVVSLVDVNLTDAMSITGQTPVAGGITVTETYAETKRILYNTQYPILPDAQRYAIVAPNSTVPGYHYFDKVVTFSDAIANELFEFEFQILNSTGHRWWDYHFEIWNPTFTVRQTAPWFNNDPNNPQLDLFSDQFTGLELHPDVATFRKLPNLQEFHEDGEIGIYKLKMNLYAFANSDSGSFGMRQVATTTPEPASMAIFGIGSGMLLYARRRARSTAKSNEAN